MSKNQKQPNAAAQLVHSQEINHFRESFRKVFLALQKSSEDNKTLIRKCRTLGRRLAETGTKLHQLVEIKRKDDGLVQDLRFKLKDAWMTAETYRSREHSANRLVKQMKSELDKLKAEVNRLHIENKELNTQLQQSSTQLFSKHRNRTTSHASDGSVRSSTQSTRPGVTLSRPSTSAGLGVSKRRGSPSPTRLLHSSQVRSGPQRAPV